MKNLNLDKQSLILFDALIETENLSLAAEKAGLPVATASRKIKKLEALFGEPLFNRWMNGMLATEYALQLKMPVREALKSLDRIMDLQPFDPMKLRQKFRIACVDNAAFSVLSPILPMIFKQAPHLCIETLPVDNDLFSNMRAGRIDMAVFPFRELPDDFVSQSVFSSEQCIVMGVDHPLVKLYEEDNQAFFEQLKNYRRIEIRVSPSDHWKKYSSEADTGGQEVALVTPYFLFAAMTLRETDLTMRLPEKTARQLEILGMLRAFPFPKHNAPNEPLLIWHKHAGSSPVLQWLRSLIISQHTLPPPEEPLIDHKTIRSRKRSRKNRDME